MQNTPHRFTETQPTLRVAELGRYVEGWLLACDIDQHSANTLAARRSITEKLLWYLRNHGCEECGVHELRQFLHYVTHGHKEPGGRWGNPQMNRPVRPRTVKDYHSTLRTLFRWIVSEGGLSASPLERIPVPTSRADQVQPFTDDQVKALISAAKRSRNRRRNEALVWFLLDTGVRASELCALKLEDIDMTGRCAYVLGKGNKRRTIYFGKTTARALWQYLNEDGREPAEPVFLSGRGEALTRSGLLQLIERLGEAAGLEAARCSPHTFRHTFAVSFLRGGGQVFSLQQLLGHTTLAMTNRYVALAQADLANQHRAASPADRLKSRG